MIVMWDWIKRCAGLLLLLLAFTVYGRGQSLADDIEQLKLDYQKLAQLKTLLKDMYRDYDVLKNGYEHIRSMAKGNFNLHQDFLNALLLVSPAVREYVGVRNVLQKEALLVKAYRAGERMYSSGGNFNASQLAYISGLYASLLAGSERNLDELNLVLSDGKLRMSDAERMAAVDWIDRDMDQRLVMMRDLENGGLILAGQKGVEVNDGAVMPLLFGVTK